MRAKTQKYLLIVGVLTAIISGATLSFAEELAVPVDDASTQSEVAPLSEITPQELSNLEKQDDFLNKIKTELNLSKTDYRQLMNSITETKERIKLVDKQKMTLGRQLNYLTDQVVVGTEKLVSVIVEIVSKENEIALTYEEIQMKQTALEYQKNLLKDYIRMMYQEQNTYFSVDENGEIDAVKLLFSDESVGDNLKKLKYFDLLNEAGQQMVEKLNSLTKELRAQNEALQKQKVTLETLKEQLIAEKKDLELQKESKQHLLNITSGQEKIYAQLLEQSVEQQESSLTEVKVLGDALAFMEKKIAEEGARFNPDEYQSIFDKRLKAIYNFEISALNKNFGGMAWPVPPTRGITAFFRDPGYAAVFGVPHSAVDIPAYQGSPVRAAADGVVYVAKDNGYGYSYIILAHPGGITTVYGHISQILVKPGDLITQGEVIGLSGGMPGTKGAGYMTTGPHMHFEVHLNGKAVDPLGYLPLNVFTKEQIENFHGAYSEIYMPRWEEAINTDTREHVLR